VRRFAVLAIAILICPVCAPATDFSSLPLEAQASISAAIRQSLAARYPTTTILDFALTASNGLKGDGFGYSVAIDGNTVVVGAYAAPHNGGNRGPGVAYVFVKPPSGWKNMTQTAELTASDGQNGDYFGGSVGISGNTIVVGAPEATVNGNPYEGAAYVFVEAAGGWSNMAETAKLTASDGSPYGLFGHSVALSDDTVVVGTPASNGDNPSPGTAYVFVEPSGGWTDTTQTAELSASDGVNGTSSGGLCPSAATRFSLVRPRVAELIMGQEKHTSSWSHPTAG
jgi:hypothetical protein